MWSSVYRGCATHYTAQSGKTLVTVVSSSLQLYTTKDAPKQRFLDDKEMKFTGMRRLSISHAAV